MQSERKEPQFWSRLLWILLLLLPLAILFLMPGRGLLGRGIWFLVALIISMWLVHAVLGSAVKEKLAEPETRMLDASEEPSAVREVMGVKWRPKRRVSKSSGENCLRLQRLLMRRSSLRCVEAWFEVRTQEF